MSQRTMHIINIQINYVPSTFEARDKITFSGRSSESRVIFLLSSFAVGCRVLACYVRCNKINLWAEKGFEFSTQGNLHFVVRYQHHHCSLCAKRALCWRTRIQRQNAKHRQHDEQLINRVSSRPEIPMKFPCLNACAWQEIATAV